MKFRRLTAKPLAGSFQVHRSARYFANSSASTMSAKAPIAGSPSA
jgi:hypothetical protein